MQNMMIFQIHKHLELIDNEFNRKWNFGQRQNIHCSIFKLTIEVLMIFSTLSDRPILPAIKGPGRNAGAPHSTDWEPQCQWKADQPSLAPMIWFKSNQEITCGWKYFQNEISTICRLRPHHPHLGRVCPRFYLLTEGSYPVIRKGPEKKRTPGRSRSCRGKDGRLFI